MKKTKNIKLILTNGVKEFIKEATGNEAVLLGANVFRNADSVIGVLSAKDDKYEINMMNREVLVNYDILETLSIVVVETHQSSGNRLYISSLPLQEKEGWDIVECTIYYEDGGDTFINIVSTKECIDYIKANESTMLIVNYSSGYKIDKEGEEFVISGTRYDVCRYTDFSKEDSTKTIYVRDYSVYGKIRELYVIQDEIKPTKEFFEDLAAGCEIETLRIKVSNNLIEIEGRDIVKRDVVR